MSRELLSAFVDGALEKRTVCPFAREAAYLYVDASDTCSVTRLMRVLTVFHEGRREKTTNALFVQTPSQEGYLQEVAAAERVFDDLFRACAQVTSRSAPLSPAEIERMLRLDRRTNELVGGPKADFFRVLAIHASTINTIFVSPHAAGTARFRYAPRPGLLLLWADAVVRTTEQREKTVTALRAHVRRTLGGFYSPDAVFLTDEVPFHTEPFTVDLELAARQYRRAREQALRELAGLERS